MKKNNILVGRGKIEWIAYNYILSKHAEERILTRTKKTRTLKERILKSVFAWKTYKDCVCIALDLYEYIVVYPSLKNDETNGKWLPLVVTYVNTKDENKTVVDKFIEHYNEFLKLEE